MVGEAREDSVTKAKGRQHVNQEDVLRDKSNRYADMITARENNLALG